MIAQIALNDLEIMILTCDLKHQVEKLQGCVQKLRKLACCIIRQLHYQAVT